MGRGNERRVPQLVRAAGAAPTSSQIRTPVGKRAEAIESVTKKEDRNV